VWIRARTDGEHAVLEVEDTGIGMDPNTADVLFESLFGERLWIVIPTEKRRSASCERHQPTHKTNAER